MPKKNYFNVVTPVGRLLYANLIEPRLKYNSTTDYEYSVRFLIPKSEDVTQLKAAIEKARADGGLKDGWMNPLKDGDVDSKTAFDAGHWWMKVTTKNKKPVKDLMKKEVEDQTELYNGREARLSLGASFWESPNGQGVKLYLSGTLLMPGGEPFVPDAFSEFYSDAESVSDEAFDTDPF